MFHLFTDDDFEVADILLGLTPSVPGTEAARTSTRSWAVRKPRSLREKKTSPAVSVFRSLSPPSVCPTTDVAPAPAAYAPLVFPVGGEAKYNKNNLSANRDSRKRTKERLLETIDELTRNNKLLKMEIERIHLCVLKQKTTNLRLKAKIQAHLSFSRIFGQNSPGKSEDRPADGNVDRREQPQIARVPRQPLFAHRTVQRELSTEASCMYPYSPADVRTRHDGDVGCEQPLDLSLAKSMAAALARQRRKEIYRSKNSHASQKLVFVGRC